MSDHPPAAPLSIEGSDDPPATPVTIESSGRAIIARPQVKLLDDVVVKELARLVDAATAAQPDAPPLIVDLSRVALIPSIALGLLVQMANKCQARGQELKLSGVQPQVRKLFSTTRLDRVFRLTDAAEAPAE